jgi:hypothetical protein
MKGGKTEETEEEERKGGEGDRMEEEGDEDYSRVVSKLRETD